LKKKYATQCKKNSFFDHTFKIMSKKNAAAAVVEDVYNSFSDDEIDLDNKTSEVKNTAAAKNGAARNAVSFPLLPSVGYWSAPPNIDTRISLQSRAMLCFDCTRCLQHPHRTTPSTATTFIHLNPAAHTCIKLKIALRKKPQGSERNLNA